MTKHTGIEQVQDLMMKWDVQNIRDDFPILMQKINDHDLVYLDNAASTQKPRTVVAHMTHFYMQDYANIHRGVFTLSERATAEFEKARKIVQKFLNAKSLQEIVFTNGTTHAINMVANSLGRSFLKHGDEIIISGMEHHSNIVPWQVLRDEIGIELKVIPIDIHGEIILEKFTELLSPRTKLVSICHISNSLGTVNPIKTIIDQAHAVGALVFIDGAQSAAHQTIDVVQLDCDFFAFSGHKTYGPTGVGVLYGKQHLLEKMPPYHTGGNMVETVRFEKTTYQAPPYKFEAGTMPIVEVIGLGEALSYLQELGLEAIARYENELLLYATQALQEIPGLRIIGQAQEKSSIISFVMEGIHPHDIGSILDQYGVAVRAGHHCTMPVMEFFQVPATARASFALYNTYADIDALVFGLLKVKELFKR
jgi:cysteine desulfurase / selenocysteine lyase